MDTRDDLTKQYFNGENISVTGRFDPIQFPGGVLNRDISPMLLGVPDDSKIFVKQISSGILLEATHPMFSAPRKMVLNKDGVLDWEGFFLRDDAPESIGTRMAATTLLTASQLGVPRVELIAWGPPCYNGHYTWARMEFNAGFDKADREKLSRAGFATGNASELMRTAPGRDWWKRNGWSKEMTFELDANSESMQTLNRYLSQNGVKL